jgi:hypothetical protein
VFGRRILSPHLFCDLRISLDDESGSQPLVPHLPE